MKAERHTQTEEAKAKKTGVVAVMGTWEQGASQRIGWGMKESAGGIVAQGTKDPVSLVNGRHRREWKKND